MAVAGVSREEFTRRINTCLTIKPVRSPEQLKGRDSKLREIERALSMPGRTVFVHGDRGVGKTSLAQTAAVIAQGQRYDPIVVGCNTGEDFFSLMGAAVKRMHATRVSLPKTEFNLSLNIPFVSANLRTQIEAGEAPSFATINEAIDAVRFVSSHYSEIPIVIFDEFNELSDGKSKKMFADFAKQISDQSVPVRVIFCGVGRSMEELLGLHASSGRSIKPIKLNRLDDSALWSIVDYAAQIVGLRVDRETILRIALLSDGFPYFVHLVCEYMFWSAFESGFVLTCIRPTDFDSGVLSATEHSDTILKDAYNKATQKYKNYDQYEEAIWAFADQPTLTRQSSEVYQKSYLKIVAHRNSIRVCRGEQEQKPLQKDEFDRRLARLKSDAHGEILKGSGSGWYEFRENMMRGYVRLRAREKGINLGIDHHHASPSARELHNLRQVREAQAV
jgi:hypothetical protein